MIRKNRPILIITSILLLLFLSGCRVSKTGYERQMTRILTDFNKEISTVQEQLYKVPTAPETGPKAAKKPEDARKKELDLLKEVKKNIERVTPPDEFFAGHSDIVEFLDLLIKSKELLAESQKKTPTPEARTEFFETFQASSRAFSRAVNELPFLDYELREAFTEVIRNTSMQTQGFQPRQFP